jgi:hypothetical protein
MPTKRRTFAALVAGSSRRFARVGCFTASIALVSLNGLRVARADDTSVGPNGINALGSGLSGDEVGIGQIELGRPGDGFGDGGTFTGDSINFVNTSVLPFRVYNGASSATSNEPLGTVQGVTTNGSLIYTITGATTGPGPDTFQAITDSLGNIPAGTIVSPNTPPTATKITMSATATASTPDDETDTLTYSGIDNHAEGVAGTMISKDQVGTGGSAGVAPKAFLFSSFFSTGQTNAALADQYVIQQASAANLNHPIVAMNYSFSSKTPNGYAYDGSALLTEYVDWSARVNNVLYVIAGNEGPAGFAIPTDNYNGLTVSFTQQNGGVFNQVNPGNTFTEAPANGRSVVGLTAPGTNLNLTGINSSYYTASGTSFAAPQVTAGDALVVNYDNNQIAAGNLTYEDAEQAQVEKAILLNSADKVQNVLGMNKTITNTAGQNYFNSVAYNNPNQNVPLDPQMGSGQLDVNRALTQVAGGEWHSLATAVVPLIGWDYSFTVGNGDINKYIFNTPLQGGSYISATLDWDRMVTLNNNTGNPLLDDTFSAGDTFNVVGLTDLHLLLETVGADPQIVWQSISDVDSVQQIFFQIPATGNYQLLVDQVGATAGGGVQEYGLAWWAVPEPSSEMLLLLGIAPLGYVYYRRRAAPFAAT